MKPSPLASLHLTSDKVDPLVETKRELLNAYERIEQLEADLLECLEYFKAHYDVVDGDYGEPAPNKEMRLGNMIQETLYGPGAF